MTSAASDTGGTRTEAELRYVLRYAMLAATVEGVAASPLNQPVQVDELRPRIGTLAGRPGHAQIVLRLGYGPAVEASPRRPLDEVLL